MTDRPLAAWEDSRERPYSTITVGGPLDARVEISNAPAGRGAAIVVATWTRDGEVRTVSAPAEDYEGARTLAHRWADQLASGDDPT